MKVLFSAMVQHETMNPGQVFFSSAFIVSSSSIVNCRLYYRRWFSLRTWTSLSSFRSRQFAWEDLSLSLSRSCINWLLIKIFIWARFRTFHWVKRVLHTVVHSIEFLRNIRPISRCNNLHPRVIEVYESSLGAQFITPHTCARKLKYENSPADEKKKERASCSTHAKTTFRE